MNTIYLSTNGDTIIPLGLPIIVEEDYECGVIQLHGRVLANTTEALYLCCDICEESRVEDKMLPVLCRVRRNQGGVISTDINHVSWLPIVRKPIQHIRLYICTEDGEIVSLRNRRLYCTLQIRPLRVNNE